MNPAMRLGLCLSLLALGSCNADSGIARLSMDGAVLETDIPRYGLNLGGSGTWGAEQLRANVLANPGFEAVLDRTILILKDAASSRIVDDTDWLARPDGFWSNGSYSIRSGRDAGRSGAVLDSRKRPADGLAEIWLDGPVDNLKPGDVVTLTRRNDLQPAPQWWSGKGRIANAVNDIRPGSPGYQSIRLMALPGQPAELLHYLDNIADRAGKLLPLRGPWRLAFWARSKTQGSQLHVHLDRGGHTTFIDTDIVPEEGWKYYQFDIDTADTGPAGVLTLGLTAKDGEILIDDAFLGEADAGVGGFRRVVVETLKSLNPGFLRDWQGQLGDTLANRLAEPYGHQPVRYRPGEQEAQYHYSLPEFMALCAAVGAQPWVVAPTTLDDDEWRGLGRYLRDEANRYGFREILVEFGNENWNLIFRPGGIPDAATSTLVADRSFRLLREGSGDDRRLLTVVNAQFVNPDQPRQIGSASLKADRVAVAPYFLYSLDSETRGGEAIQAAFAESDELIRAEAETARLQGKRLAVYEENFHTTLGNADAETRNAVVTGAASGPALARRLLQGTLAGVREQAVYTLAGFDNRLQDGQSLVRLWGITRDLTTADRFRPTGLALALLNRVAGGTVREVLCSGTPCGGLTAVSFGDGRKLAIVSSRAESVPISLSLPCPGDAPQLDVLDGSQPYLNNEQLSQVQVTKGNVTCANGKLDFTLPAFSLAVLYR